ncbi:MAG: glucosamine-6-phosphate deaminase [Ectothiorhodospiraceae bacterium]|nr:glucosamine-6-phosphate deaminase [Ectothiorhodospiraceae bacterium]
MELIVLKTPEQCANAAANLVEEQLNRKPDSVLGLPTGKTSLPLYQELVRRHRRGQLRLDRATTFNLDEYLGLGPDHPASFARYMRERLFAPLALPPGQCHLPDGMAADPCAEAEGYEARIREAGGIDLQLLGIGINGHIGFNEPGAPLDSRTRVVNLCSSTLEANRSHFPPGEAPPAQAITMGVGTILEARRIVLLATGRAKAHALHAAISGPVSPEVPASALQRHPNCVMILDAAAASDLPPAIRTGRRHAVTTSRDRERRQSTDRS